MMIKEKNSWNVNEVTSKINQEVTFLNDFVFNPIHNTVVNKTPTNSTTANAHK